ncbi:hypothetical protein LCGC14_1941190 [marine sediment metagenome]|uniref:YopX protein domain-containing protein n=1 Tax=marine sediment metagenome TaxID=412755 RepID=A0A0F9FK86_9ZZZZ
MFNLKLRAWYKPEQIMCRVAIIDFKLSSDYSIYYSLANDSGTFHGVPRIDIDLMLSFGAKDKNQQIIFNKDIIKHDFPDYENCSVVPCDEYPIVTHYGIVNLRANHYDNGFYITNLIHDDYPNAPFYDEMGQNFVWNELEKIGNVYETVLLKCSHCDNIDFINCPDIVGPCSVCGEQNLINIDLLKYKEVTS